MRVVFKGLIVNKIIKSGRVVIFVALTMFTKL